MSADQPRNRTVGSKMTDSEFECLAAVAEEDGMTLGEWVREVLLERADGRKPSVIEETLLAEVLALRALRTILLNLHFAVAKGETITTEAMQAIIERADAGKAKKAAEQQKWGREGYAGDWPSGKSSGWMSQCFLSAVWMRRQPDVSSSANFSTCPVAPALLAASVAVEPFASS